MLAQTLLFAALLVASNFLWLRLGLPQGVGFVAIGGILLGWANLSRKPVERDVQLWHRTAYLVSIALSGVIFAIYLTAAYLVASFLPDFWHRNLVLFGVFAFAARIAAVAITWKKSGLPFFGSTVTLTANKTQDRRK